MYPQQFFSLVSPFPTSNRVFVAMTFGGEWDCRFDSVIDPGIRRVLVNGTPLEPYRVDRKKIADSILTEILGELATARLVFCDVTTIGLLHEGAGKDGKITAVRNGNVMYELGLAQAIRPPQEILIFRSDADRLLFDLSTIRVNSYTPDAEPETARRAVAEAVADALKETNATRSLAVRRAAAALDFTAWSVLVGTQGTTISHPVSRTMRDVMENGPYLSAVSRMLELGLLESAWKEMTPAEYNAVRGQPAETLIEYRLTPLAEAVRRIGRESLREAPEEIEIATQNAIAVGVSEKGVIDPT